ncbi:MAG: hypothetical protein M3P08_03010 [Thermoproteota archaeon]|nr:hypothetical protein [Thermoproteota archaeon]
MDPVQSFRFTSLPIYISCKIKISIPHLKGVLKICPMSEQVIKQSVVYCWTIMSFLSSQSQTTTTSSVTLTTVKGFSIYENITHNVSIQYPSDWNKHEILNSDFTAVVMFLVPIKLSFSSREDSEIILQKIRDIVYNDVPTTVVVSIKRRLPVHYTSDTLQDITNDQIHLLDICFDNVSLLETSYDRKMGEIQASKLIYTYTDPLENHIDKKGMKIISVQGHKEMVITYGSQNQDFDKFISTVDRMVGTFRIVE